MVMKFCGEVDRDRKHLPAKFRVSLSLRLSVPLLGKRPRGSRRLRPMGPAALGEKKTGKGEIEIGEPIERVDGGG